MWIDIIFLIVLITAIVKGASKGIILALFSFIGWLVGLAAALKLSAVVAVYLQEHTDTNARWLPVLSFLLVFIAAVFLVRLAGKAIEGMFEVALLGWVNRMGGALLFAVINTIILCVVLFYVAKMHIISEETLASSKFYTNTASLAPGIIDGIGTLVPAVKSMFQQLEDFFENGGRRFTLAFY